MASFFLFWLAPYNQGDALGKWDGAQKRKGGGDKIIYLAFFNEIVAVVLLNGDDCGDSHAASK
jgi:hypothetical protein